MSGRYIAPLQGCSLTAAARALGIRENRVIDLLVRGELEGMTTFGLYPLGARTLIKVTSIRNFISRGTDPWN